jgi:hypothetical protein
MFSAEFQSCGKFAVFRRFSMMRAPKLPGPFAMNDQQTGRIGWPKLVLWTALFQIAWFWQAIPGVLTQGAMPDTDDFLRLVQVRDWLAGQGWYDLVQHRMDPPAGADIHWSRLVDMPIAALIAFFSWFTEPVMAGRLATIVWPMLLLCATVLVVVDICRRLAPAASPLLALLFTVACITALTEFMPGRIDHHSVQILLFCLMLLGLVSRPRWWAAPLIGVAASASLTVGAEAMMLVAFFFAWLGLDWARGQDQRGRGLAGAAAGIFLSAPPLYAASFPPAQWFAVHCDANSIVFLSALLGVAGGFALLSALSGAADSPKPATRLTMRLALGGVVGGVLVGVLYGLFPQCAAGPLASMDAELQTRWLVNVSEAQGLFTLMERTPSMLMWVVGYCAALTGVALIVLRREAARNPALIAVFAAFAISMLLSVIQYRTLRIGMFASIPFCVIFAQMLGRDIAERFTGSRALGMSLQVAAVAMLISPPWLAAGELLFPNDRPTTAATPAAHASDSTQAGEPDWRHFNYSLICNEARHFERLAALPKGLVMSDINSGPAILANTAHSVVGGPYHRNARAILDIVDFFETDLDKPRQIADARRPDYVVYCDTGMTPDAEEAKSAALTIAIIQGRAPQWLERVSPPEERLAIFRVRD